MALSFLALYALAGVLFTRLYRDAVASHCRSHSTEGACAALVRGNDCAPTAGELPKQCSASPSDGNAWFFAVQTLSTTGYGSEVFLNVPKVQSIATYGMLTGPVFLAFFISLIVSALATKSSD